MIHTDYNNTRLTQFIARLDETAEETARLSAESIADDARSRVPTDTGALKSSIHVERDSLGSYAVVAGDSDVFYGHIVEGGSAARSLPARPFLVPAAERERLEVETTGRREFGKID